MSVARPQVSVIIPVRNGANSIGVQLSALADQRDAPPFEVIVADNGSSDDTMAVVSTFAARLDLRIVSAAEQPGPSFARNRGADVAKAPHLLFCDADDRVGPEWVAALHRALAERPIVTGPVLYVDDPATDEFHGRRPTAPRRYLDQMPFAPSNNLGMHRRLFDELDGFDLRLRCCQDADLTIRAQRGGRDIGWAPGAVVLNGRRGSLRAAAKQFFRYGYYDAAVYRKLGGDLLHPRPAWEAIRPYAVLAASAHRLLRPGRRWSWVTGAAQRAGRLVGSLRFRTLCP